MMLLIFVLNLKLVREWNRVVGDDAGAGVFFFTVHGQSGYDRGACPSRGSRGTVDTHTHTLT